MVQAEAEAESGAMERVEEKSIGGIDRPRGCLYFSKRK